MSESRIVAIDPAKGYVVLDRIITGTVPKYCIHGQSRCVSCANPVWLGTKTFELVADGTSPVCLDCMTKLHHQGKLPSGPNSHVEDHLRADGPHERMDISEKWYPR